MSVESANMFSVFINPGVKKYKYSFFDSKFYSMEYFVISCQILHALWHKLNLSMSIIYCMRKNSACLSSHHEMYSKTIVYEMFRDNTKKVTFSSYHWYTEKMLYCTWYQHCLGDDSWGTSSQSTETASPTVYRLYKIV